MKDSDAAPTEPVAGPSKLARSRSTSNEPANFSTGLKIATYCTVFLTLGLAAPLILVRRQSRALTALDTHLSPTRALHSGPSPSALLRTRNAFSLPQDPIPPFMNTTHTPPLQSETESPRAPPVAIKHAFTALFIATGLVTAVAGTSYFAFKWTTGISHIHEFTQFMRNAVASIVPPRLHSRLNAPDIFPHDPPMHSGDNRAPVNPNSQIEKRLQAAYEAGGMTKWYEQVLMEFEGEWEGQATDSEGTTVYKSGLSNDK